MKPPIFAALFDQGQTPTITFVNNATVSEIFTKQSRFQDLVAAHQEFGDKYFSPIWGQKAKCVVADHVLPGTWGMVFTDNADVAGALGYHDLTADGMPLSKIFVQTTLQNGDDPATTACHEYAEMLIDPGIQMWAFNYSKNRMEAYEVCDAVEVETFNIFGFAMSNFQHPAWFESFRAPGSAKFDYLGTCSKPFQINKGGYMSVYKNGRFSQVFASKADQEKFKLEEHSRAMMRPVPTDTFKKSEIPREANVTG